MSIVVGSGSTQEFRGFDFVHEQQYVSNEVLTQRSNFLSTSACAFCMAGSMSFSDRMVSGVET